MSSTVGSLCTFRSENFELRLCRLDFFQTIRGDVGGGEAGLEAVDVDDDSLLAGYAGYTAYQALERSEGIDFSFPIYLVQMVL